MAHVPSLPSLYLTLVSGVMGNGSRMNEQQRRDDMGKEEDGEGGGN
jgi:hypothetical protein